MQEHYKNKEFIDFFSYCFPHLFQGKKLIFSDYLSVIADRITACLNGKINRLIINIPPRYMKSSIISVALPAYYLGKDSTKNVVVASYSEILSVKHSLETKFIMSLDWYQKKFPETKISKIQNTRHKFITEKMGSRFATSVCGTLTGEGADLLIADDPISSMQASSPVFREKLKNWFLNTFMTRLNHRKKSSVIILMQRLHEEDICGYLIKNNKNWHVLSLSCIAEKDEKIESLENKKIIFKRKRGDILNSPYLDKEDINDIKSEVGSHNFNCQYQQKPENGCSYILKRSWIQRYDCRKNIRPEYITQSWDTAISLNEYSSYSVCTTFAKLKDCFYLLDIFKKKVQYPDLKTQVVENAKKWNANQILIENKSSGQSLIQELKKFTTLHIIPISPRTSKIERLYGVLSLIEYKKVFLPINSDWLEEFEDELFSFPNCRNDDQVDSFCQYLAYEKQKVSKNFAIKVL